MAKLFNGGKKFNIGGFTVDTLKAYSPRWENITSGLNAEEEVKFSLEFTTYGLPEGAMYSLQSILSKPRVPLVCDGFSGNVRCTSVSSRLASCNIYGTFYEVSAKVTECADDEINLTVGSVSVDNLLAYSPKWARVKEGLETVLRFSLDFTTYKLDEGEMTALKTALSDDDLVEITCPGYSGRLKCTNITTNYKNDDYYGGYYTLSATLAEPEAGEEEGGAGDMSITVNGYTLTKFSSYNPSWSYNADGAQQKYGRRFALNVTTYDSAAEELSALVDVIGTASDENEEITVTLSCGEWSGTAYCTSVSPAVKDNGNFQISLSFTEVTKQPETAAVTINGVTVTSFSSYNPKWAEESISGRSSVTFVNWDSEEISDSIGTRFSLDFTAHGLTHAEAMTLQAAANSSDLDVSCPEYTGKMLRNSISMNRTVSEYYGEFYDVSVSLKAALIDSGAGSGGYL